MKGKSWLALADAAGVWRVGYDLDTSVTLERDLGGTAEAKVTVDFEVVVQHYSRIPVLQTGPEIEQEMRQRWIAALAVAATKVEEDREASKAQLEQSLPAGVTPLAIWLTYEGMRMSSGFAFKFDDARKLARIVLPEGRDLGREDPSSPAGHDPATGSDPHIGSPPASVDTFASGGGSQQNVDIQPYADFFRRPFAGLQVVDNGATVRLTLTIANPLAFARQTLGSGDPPIVVESVRTFNQGSRFSFRLDSPFEVVEANPSRRAGRTLTWEMDLADPNAKVKEVLTARLRK